MIDDDSFRMAVLMAYEVRRRGQLENRLVRNIGHEYGITGEDVRRIVQKEHRASILGTPGLMSQLRLRGHI